MNGLNIFMRFPLFKIIISEKRVSFILQLDYFSIRSSTVIQIVACMTGIFDNVSWDNGKWLGSLGEADFAK